MFFSCFDFLCYQYRASAEAYEVTVVLPVFSVRDSVISFYFPLLFEASSCILQTSAFWSHKEYNAGQSIPSTTCPFIVESQFLGGRGLSAFGWKLELDLNSAQDFFTGSLSPKRLFKATPMPWAEHSQLNFTKLLISLPGQPCQC